MDVVAFAHGRDYATDILAVLDDGVAHREVLQRNLVTDGYILIADGMKLAVILGDDAEHVGAGREILYDDHADVVAAVMDEKVRYFGHGDPSGQVGLL
jgi:hypothetical protein